MLEQKAQFISSWDSSDFSSCPQNNIECANQVMTWVDICKSYCRQIFYRINNNCGVFAYFLKFLLPFLIFFVKEIWISEVILEDPCVFLMKNQHSNTRPSSLLRKMWQDPQIKQIWGNKALQDYQLSWANTWLSPSKIPNKPNVAKTHSIT